LTIGSLFSGVGGLDLAVEQVFDAQVAWFSEIDPHLAGAYRRRRPDAQPLGDITGVDWTRVPKVDVLCGGFPCQDVSEAGLRAGMGPGTRSGLWRHMAQAVAAIKPSWVVIENVAGLLTATTNPDEEEDTNDGLPAAPATATAAVHHPRPDEPHLARTAERGLGLVLGDLADLGMDAAWTLLPASSVGGCHRRRRIFILAWPAIEDPARH